MDINKLCMGCMKELNQSGGVCPHCGYNPASVSVEGHYLKPCTILNGKYLVGKVLGEGGFGITYIGYDLNLELPVAIKEFYPNGFVTRESTVTSVVSAYQGTNLDAVQKWKNNFIKEARTLAKCTNLAGIVGVNDFFEENGTAYIVMEYLDGKTLKEFAKACGGKIEVNQLLKYLEPVMASLAKVHEYGLIHRDISPDNIMLMDGGGMKLLDFGAARDYAAEGEKSLSVMLKPGYAPEEQYRTKGKQGPWSDVYAFAGTIYKCITGVTPPESMERIRNDELRRPSELGISISPQTENALMKAMAVYAEERYQTMDEFRRDLYAATTIGAAATVSTKSADMPENVVRQSQENIVHQNISNASNKEHNFVDLLKNNIVLVGIIAVVLVVAAAVLISGSGKGKNTTAKKDSNVKYIVTTKEKTEGTDDGDSSSEDGDDVIQPDSGDYDVNDSDIEANVSEDEDIDMTGQTSSTDAYTKANDIFDIDSSVIEDYSLNLNPNRYQYYGSGISDFSFFYPVNLYNSAIFNEEPIDTAYGTNIQSVTFFGTKGSRLMFSISRRDDNKSIEEMTNYVSEVEEWNLNEASRLTFSTKEDHGRVIMTGFDGTYENLIYDLVTIEYDYVLQMVIIFPQYTSDEDELQKGYMVECVYRMCGFSGSSARPRSYEEYCEYWRENM